MSAMDTDPQFAKASAQISAVTAVARVLGFARWIVFGATVGATYLGNVYQTTNWIPNILFELAAGGMLSSVFVPAFVAELGRDTRRTDEIASSIVNVFLLAIVPVIAAGIVFGRPIMRALTFAVDDPDVRAREVELGAWFLRFFLPQVPMYFVGMVARSLLHANRRFVAAAAAPALSSLAAIGAYVTFAVLRPGADLATATGTQLWVLALGTTGGIVAWTLVQLAPLWRLGYRWRPVLRWSDGAVRRAIVGAWHGGAYFAVTEIGVIVTIVLANRVRGGFVVWGIAYAFYETPNALTALPISVSLAPSLAGRVIAGDEPGFARLLTRGWRTPALLVVPAAAGLAALAGPLSELVLRRGDQGALLGALLGSLALGLPAFALSQSLVRAWYARSRTRPPVAVNAVAIGIYCAGAVAATVALDPSGAGALRVLGATHAAGQWIGLAFAVVLLASSVRAWEAGRDAAFLAATVARSAVMGVAVWAVSKSVAAWGPAARVGAGVATGLAVYALVSSRVPELRQAVRALRARAA